MEVHQDCNQWYGGKIPHQLTIPTIRYQPYQSPANIKMIALIIAVLSPFVVRSVTGTVAVLAPCSCITLDDSTCPAPT